MKLPFPIAGSAPRLRLDTLVKLRWLAIIGQSAAVAIVHFGLGFKLPFAWCFAVIAVSAALNLALRARFPAPHRFDERSAAFLLGFDILQLAMLLFLTGGLQNPFALLFLAPVLISAAALRPEHTLVLWLLAVGCATMLAIVHLPLPWLPGEQLAFPFTYVVGIWISILIGAGFIGVYTWRVAEEGRQLANALAATELVLAREQHLTQIDGLAAAAAHELGTPLATIALVSKELSRRVTGDAEMAEDITLLREQVERCRQILRKLTSLGQEDEGAFLARISLKHMIEEIVEPQRGMGVPIRVGIEGEGPSPYWQRNAGLMYGLANLVDNAVDFARGEVRITASYDERQVSIEIADDGPGFAPEVLLRLGEPYISTRGAGERVAAGEGEGEEGKGLGLGIFIAKTLIERSRAQMIVRNAAPPGSGAIVRIIWPRDLFEIAPRGEEQLSGA